jgi:hypothetical protein
MAFGAMAACQETAPCARKGNAEIRHFRQ